MRKHNETEVIEEVNHDLEFAANLLLNARKSPEQTKQILMEDGVEASRAQEIVEHVRHYIAVATRERAGRDILNGSLWFIGGVFFSLYSYYTESYGNGWYILTYAAIFLGAIQIMKGLLRF